MKKPYSFFSLFFLFFTTLSATAQVGVKDFSFGYMGVAYTTFDTMDVSGKAIVLLPDGKMVVGGADSFQHAVLIRYNSDGTLDTTFGAAGKVITPVPLTGTASSPSLALLPDSATIIWAGSFDGQLTLIKYQGNGAPDSSFATNGILQAPLVAGWRLAPRRVLMKGDTILVETSATDSIALNRVKLIRFLSNGTPDLSFGINASVDIAQDSSHVFPRSMVLQPDGKIVIACQASHLDTPMVDYDFAVVRLLPNGSIDNTYGTNGWVITDFGFSADDPSSMVMQTDGKVIVCGTSAPDSDNGILLARYNTDGTPDSTFDGDGKAISLYKNESDRPIGVLFKSDSTLMVGGCSDTSYFASIQLGGNGGRDESYNRFGVVLGIMPGTNGQVYDIALQPDDKMLLAGDAILNGHRFMTVCRLEANPFPVGGGGVWNEDMSMYPHNIAQIAVYVDQNQNGIRDTTEPFVFGGNAMIHENKSNYTWRGFLDRDSVPIFDTSWYISYVPPTRYYTVFPDSIASSVHGYNNRVYDTFGIVPIPGIADAAIKITLPQNIARVGTTINAIVTYGNVGTDTLSGIVKYAKPHFADYVSAAPVPASVVGDTLIWNFVNQLPGLSNDIIISLGVPLPPIVALHDWFHHYAIVIPDQTDSSIKDNEAVADQIIGNSWDPNVKAETHNGSISTTQIANGDYLNYRIDFQNTGNDTAYNVFVKDVLDAGKVDPSTLELLGASHNANMTLQGNIAVWTFSNINLSDSGRSQDSSHGYINYRIKPRASLNIGDVINNTASIYFDQNAPVITNTEKTTVTGQILPLRLLSFTARRNNKANLLQWSAESELKLDRYEVQRSANGMEFAAMQNVKCKMQNGGANEYDFTDNSPLTTHNYYRLKMVNKDGRFAYSPIRVVDNTTTFYVSVYPNPAKDKLQVMLSSEKNATLQMQALTQDGKVVLSRGWTVQEGISTQTLNVSGLQKGNYFLKITAGNKEQSVVKFEKL